MAYISKRKKLYFVTFISIAVVCAAIALFVIYVMPKMAIVKFVDGTMEREIEIAESITALSPSAEIETVSTTGQPSFLLKASVSISVCFFSLISLLLRATTVGIPNSKSCVVKKRLRLRLVASTMFMITSGFSFLT